MKKQKDYKLWIIYGLIFLICIFGIGFAMYKQYFKDDKIGVIFGITDSEDEDEYNELKNNFSNIFTNDLENMQEDISVSKIREDFDIVVTRYNNENVSIPIININNEEVQEYNQYLIDEYKKVELEESDIYTVKYKAYIQNDILSLVIYSEFKEEDANQRIKIDTFNYDLVQNKKLSLEEILNVKDVNISYANNKIKSEIEKIQEDNDKLSEIGYNLYKRDVSSDIYSVENTEQFFIGDNGNIYVIYAYGNEDITSEMDIVIFINN